MQTERSKRSKKIRKKRRKEEVEVEKSETEKSILFGLTYLVVSLMPTNLVSASTFKTSASTPGPK